MKYLRMPHKDQYEEVVIPTFFNKKYYPNGTVAFDETAKIDFGTTQFTKIEEKCLAIDPETVSWAFLNEKEYELCQELNGKQVRETLNQLSYDHQNQLFDFIARLFRRGLLNINGTSSVDADIFNDSPNNFEGNLVELLLTEKCNLNCGYCLAGANPKMPTMNEEIARKSIDLAFVMNEADSITFEFSGGEPFLQFRLMQKITDYLFNHPLKNGRTVYVGAQTNATMLNEERVKWIKEHDIIIGVSIDGNPASHNVSRPMVNGGESFDKVIDGIRLLQKYEVQFGILVVLNVSNVDSVENLIEFLAEYNLPALKLNPIAYLGTARENWDAFGLTSDKVINYFKDFARMIVDKQYVILEDNLVTMMKYCMTKQRSNRCMRTHCGAGETFQAINAKGDIYPCGRSTQSPLLKIGNVMQGQASLSEIGLANQFVREIKERRPGDFEDCSTCLYRQMCQAGCSVQAFERYGTVKHKTPECAFYKTMYPYLMHWLTFNPHVLGHFNRIGYFEKGVEAFEFDYFDAPLVVGAL